MGHQPYMTRLVLVSLPFGLDSDSIDFGSYLYLSHIHFVFYSHNIIECQLIIQSSSCLTPLGEIRL